LAARWLTASTWASAFTSSWLRTKCRP
jgi:hypothetical protein